MLDKTESINKLRSKFQDRVRSWIETVFGINSLLDRTERGMRFCEESLELVQALGLPKMTVLQIVKHVYDRPVGDVIQECGQVVITLTALGEALSLDLSDASETELARIFQPAIMELIKSKHKLKPKFMVSDSAAPTYHKLYCKGEGHPPELPECYIDYEGDTVLSICKLCGAAEMELVTYPTCEEYRNFQRVNSGELV